MTEEMIKGVAFVVDCPFQISHRESLTRKTANHHVAFRDIGYLYVMNIILEDMSANILPIGGNGVFINVISPNDTMTCLNHSKIQTTSTTEQRDYFHRWQFWLQRYLFFLRYPRFYENS